MKDLISGLVVSVVDPQPGDTIIDCCAAPGGKTLFMASRLSRQGKKMEWRVGFNVQLFFFFEASFNVQLVQTVINLFCYYLILL